MSKRFVFLLLLCGFSLLCRAQTVTLTVVDKSTLQHCPVRLSGKIEMTESEVNGVNQTSYASDVSTTNLSNSPIVAMVTFTTIANSVGPLVGENHLLDAFFAHDLEIAPGRTYTHDHPDNGKLSTPVNKQAVKKVPDAGSQMIFVQFADGQICGDFQDARVVSLMDTRADLLLALKRIDDASQKGDAEFLKALAEKATDRTGNAGGILDHIRDMQKQKGSAAALEYIRSMLAVAASRS
jgi:hypothetical protein